MSNHKTCKWITDNESPCGLVFESELAVYNHVIESHSCSGKSNCKWQTAKSLPICNVVFRHKNMLRDHAATHFSNRVRPFTCSFCPLLFRSSRCVRDHHAKAHSDTIYDSASTQIPIKSPEKDNQKSDDFLDFLQELEDDD